MAWSGPLPCRRATSDFAALEPALFVAELEHAEQFELPCPVPNWRSERYVALKSSVRLRLCAIAAVKFTVRAESRPERLHRVGTRARMAHESGDDSVGGDNLVQVQAWLSNACTRIVVHFPYSMISESSTLQARALGEPSQNAFAAERYVCANVVPPRSPDWVVARAVCCSGGGRLRL